MSILAECSGSDRRGLGMAGLLTRDPLPGGGGGVGGGGVESLCCVLEQDTLSAA